MKQRFNVTGMTCSACSAHVQGSVYKLSGVEKADVNLLTNSMTVEYDAQKVTSNDIIRAVEKAGYGAYTGEKKREEAKPENRGGGEAAVIKKRLILSFVFLALLMYISMGHMLSLPLPGVLHSNMMLFSLTQFLLLLPVLYCNRSYYSKGIKALFSGAPNMDTLIALGSGASLLYSIYAMLAIAFFTGEGNFEAARTYGMNLYFESAGMILTLITVGKMLEARSKGKTTDALKSLMKLSPKKATLLREGREVEVAIEEVVKGDLFVVRPGESIPVDGVVLEGISAVNEAALTGESVPVDKEEGSNVSAATVNHSGFLKCRATRVGEDTTLSQIIQMVSDAAATKAPIAKVADKVSGVFVPTVIGIALLTMLIWLVSGQSVGFALARGISVLVISCPCALGLATPVAIMVGNGMGAKHGIMFKTAVSLEETGKMDIVALDKTGTITKGEPEVTDLVPADGISEEELLKLAYILEKKSEHPLAHAVISEAEKRELSSEKEVTDFQAVAGNGLTGKLEQKILAGGNLNFIRSQARITEEEERRAQMLAEEGKTPLFFAKEGEFLGMIAVADVMKEDSHKAVKELQNMGIHVVMLTGDNERTAKAIGRQAGVDEVIAGVLPDGKESVIRKLKKQGKVAMVGDGINDAPALTRADMGIAIGAGTDIALDAADVVLMKSRLSDVPAAIRLSRATLQNIHENLFWAFIYNIIGIPLAAGIWYPLFGWKLNPMFGAAAMSLSSFCVVTNALRLNLFSVHGKANKDAAPAAEPVEIKTSESEEKVMTKTMHIEGMMCGHCEATVKKALEALPEVTSAEVSHEAGTAVVTLSSEVADDVLKKTVEEKDYKVTAID